MKDGHLEETLRRILAEAISQEVSDPRVGMVTVSEVRLNKDNTVAEVFVTAMSDDPDERRKSLKGLRNAKGFLRGKIGDAVRLRVLPDLRFRYDESLDRSFRVERLLDEIGQDGEGEAGA